MKSAVFRLRFWHRWIGICALLPLLIVSLTGTILVYKKPIIHFFVAQQAALPQDYSPQKIATQLDNIAQLASLQNAVRAKAPNQQEPYWTLTDQHGQHQLYAIGTLKPYQQNLWLLDGLSVVHHLHTELLLDKTGKTLLLLSSLLSLFLLFSGVWLWWPGKKGFRWRFVKPWPMKMKMMLQFHRHTGIVVTPVLAIIVFTAAIMMWQKVVTPLLPALPLRSITPEQALSQDGLSATQAMRLAQSQLPASWPTYIRFPQDEVSHYRFRYRLSNEWHSNGRTYINVDQSSGNMEATEVADQLPWQYRLINQTYPLHSGYGINGIYQLLILLAGLGLAWVSATGLLSYLRQSLPSRRK
ncbi:PepSY-associated TM helix domain-containing protein [Shewanella sp. Isolate11]|uniref:PepSY-associated TM helix domain-containing protein n=1 Tax=Shewanella sp. Isolate11 TaxID=2908530 RepID=UPI001EFDE5EF|nr:PepSY-associated TM helix domain-containing protein [Shewanella sp. Isolate11]MCG9695376.1 PepSY domain-containing protein [Shewanella sp. Isolate11]